MKFNSIKRRSDGRVEIVIEKRFLFRRGKVHYVSHSSNPGTVWYRLPEYKRPGTMAEYELTELYVKHGRKL